MKGVSSEHSPHAISVACFVGLLDVTKKQYVSMSMNVEYYERGCQLLPCLDY